MTTSGASAATRSSSGGTPARSMASRTAASIPTWRVVIVPNVRRDRASTFDTRSSISATSRSISSMASWRPSRANAVSTRTRASGVRSSCDTTASRWRSSRTCCSRRSAIVSIAVATRATSSRAWVGNRARAVRSPSPRRRTTSTSRFSGLTSRHDRRHDANHSATSTTTANASALHADGDTPRLHTVKSANVNPLATTIDPASDQ